MSILSFILLLTILAVAIYGIKLALAGNWKELLWLAVGLIVVIIILQVLGVELPNIPTVR